MLFARSTLLAAVSASLLAAAPAGAVVLNNGSAPPDPANLIDDDRYSGQTLYVRNVGCPPGHPDPPEDDPCPSPGAPTVIEYTHPGASALWALEVLDSSSAVVDGGWVRTAIRLENSASLHFVDGQLGIAAQGQIISAGDSSTIVIDAGLFDAGIAVSGDASMTIHGGTFSNFALPTATLSGTASLTLTGGDVDLGMRANDQTMIDVTGGDHSGSATANDDGSIQLSGGRVAGLRQTDGTIRVSGTGSFSGYESLPGGSSPGYFEVTSGNNGRVWVFDPMSVELRGGSGTSIISDGSGVRITISDSFVADHLIIGVGELVMRGGQVLDDVQMRNIGEFVLAGGTVANELSAGNGSITVVGSGFQVDGVPVPYGPIAPQTGTLTGTLASGDPVDNLFYHGGLADPACYLGACNGTVVLVHCGNGILDAGEACDDGNTDAGDCCSPTCGFEAGPGTPDCCSMGVCQVTQGCGAVCFAGPSTCKQPGGPGTACICTAP